MTDQQFHQLRFDISENIRLHTHQPHIKQLLELDLYPDVEINEKGDHLTIEGFLRLKGAYYGEEADEDDELDQVKREELSYIIPVEITLPADRAKLKHISAEIESFDYQVLSPFELQIDAILLIDGLIPEEDGEESEEKIEAKVPTFSGSEAIMETKNQLQTSQDEKLSVSNQQESLDEIESTSTEEDPSKLPERESKDEQQLSDESTDEYKEDIRQPEMMVTEEETGETDEQKSLAMEEEELDQTRDDWAKWLLRGNEENFTSMRMVIVQENDSVQKLAERYDISPSQIRQVNDLEDRELEKGEILYIPQRPLESVSDQDS